MKLIEIYKSVLSEYDDLHNVNMDGIVSSPVDPQIEDESKVILLIHQLEQMPEVIQQLQNLKLLSSKYKAIQEFANLLGIPPEQFDATMQQAKIQSTI
jgi:hypothetical protein